MTRKTSRSVSKRSAAETTHDRTRQPLVTTAFAAAGTNKPAALLSLLAMPQIGQRGTVIATVNSAPSLRFTAFKSNRNDEAVHFWGVAGVLALGRRPTAF